MADLPIASDAGAPEVEIVQSSTQNKMAVSANGALPPHSDVTGTGTITALNGTVVITVNGCSSILFSVTGVWVATLNIEAQASDGTWTQVLGEIPLGSLTGSFTANGIVVVPCGGYFQVRIRAALFTSGTASIAWNAGAGINIVQPINLLASAFNATVQSVPASLGVTTTGASGAVVTLTLPAVAGVFHYITHVEIVAYTALARVGVAAPVLVTSTNIPGGPVWDFSTAAAIGTTDIKAFDFSTPIRSLSANTATTIVGPATTSIIWRLTVFYYTGL